ncbi:hypothetical protein [Sporosarcina sp. NPDC096371]|uniref:hypothetical protein n=1 Tax=Sporosarcina sp. NPDC096371 TaxID=3364530 RepID=UPI0038309F8C
MGLEYVLWIGSPVLLIIGWGFFKFFYGTNKKYFIPYILFQLGISLLVTSIFIIGGWSGMAYGFISLVMMGMGLIAGILVWSYTLIQTKRFSR